jgi:hypothetical protein
MKSLILTLVACLAILAAAAPSALAVPPFSTDLVLDATNKTADFTLAEAVQPEVLRLYNVLPLSDTPQTVTVERVHGDYTETLHNFVLGSNVSSGSAVLTNAAWILLEDFVRLTGGTATNAVLEFQGNR